MPQGSLRESGHFAELAVHSPAGSEEKSNIEVIILVCTGLAATLFWLLLTLFIRKLRKVRELPPAHTLPAVLAHGSCRVRGRSLGQMVETLGKMALKFSPWFVLTSPENP